MTDKPNPAAQDVMAQAIVDLMYERYPAEVWSGDALEALVLAGQRLCGPRCARQVFESCFVIKD